MGALLLCKAKIVDVHYFTSVETHEAMTKYLDTLPENVNLYVQMHLQWNKPALPEREGIVEVWIKENKFRVRDNTGRYVHEMLEDIEAKSGLGHSPGSLEEMMDISHRVLNLSGQNITEFYGDIETDEAIVQEWGREPWATEAKRVVPIAAQIFTDGVEQHLEQVSTATRFGRECVEYHGYLKTDSSPYKTETVRIISAPFVILSRVQDPENKNHYFTRKLVSFKEGVVTDADVEQPVIEEKE